MNDPQEQHGDVDAPVNVQPIPRQQFETEARRRLYGRKALNLIAAALVVVERMFQGAAFGARDRLFNDPMDVVADMADVLRTLNENIEDLQCWHSIDEGAA